MLKLLLVLEEPNVSSDHGMFIAFFALYSLLITLTIAEILLFWRGHLNATYYLASNIVKTTLSAISWLIGGCIPLVIQVVTLPEYVSPGWPLLLLLIVFLFLLMHYVELIFFVPLI
jgi:hypothetical protein